MFPWGDALRWLAVVLVGVACLYVVAAAVVLVAVLWFHPYEEHRRYEAGKRACLHKGRRE